MRYVWLWLRQRTRPVFGALIWAAAAAALTGAFGAVGGGYYAGVQCLLHGADQPFLVPCLRITLSAAATGAILGAFLRLFDGVNPFSRASEPETAAVTSPTSPAERRAPELPAPIESRLQRAPREAHLARDGHHGSSRN